MSAPRHFLERLEDEQEEIGRKYREATGQLTEEELAEQGQNSAQKQQPERFVQLELCLSSCNSSKSTR